MANKLTEELHSIGKRLMNTMSLMPTKLFVLVLLGLAPALAATVSTIYTNFGPSDVYNTSQGNPVGNAFDGNTYAEGDAFILGGSAVFSSLRISLSCIAFCTDPFVVSLTTDSDNQPDVRIESFVVPAGNLGLLGANNAPVVLNSGLNPVLTPGIRYWITVSAGLNDSIDWNLNSTGDQSETAISSDGGVSWFGPSGNTPGAFEVDGIIPEPQTFGLILTSGVLVALWRVSRRIL